MAADYTRQWIQFFTGCGIPQDVAASYGLIFNKNRIQKNMLLDLNKEYLRDMGITVMGDVIAILRHAKVVHDKYIKEQILSESQESINSLSFTNALPTETKGKSTATFMSKKIGGYDDKKKIETHTETESSGSFLKNEVANIDGQNKIVKKKIPVQAISKESVKSDSSLQKVRYVLKDTDGSSIVKMPSGTTERSKKILLKAKLKQKTVFARLGESCVSSTSDVVSTTSPSNQGKISVNKEKNTSSVFLRLGEKSPQVTSTSTSEDYGRQRELPYRGILKSNSPKKKPCPSPNRTMRADNEFKANNPERKKIDLKERLGTNVKQTLSGTPNPGLKSTRQRIMWNLEDRQYQSNPSSNKLESIAQESVKDKKYIHDDIDTIRSKPTVSSTQPVEKALIRRSLKRKLEHRDLQTNLFNQDQAQAKKVRFGTTTQRLIPANKSFTGETSKFTSMIGINNGLEINNSMKNVITSHQIRLYDSDNEKRQKPSIKDRIGCGVLVPRDSFQDMTINNVKKIALSSRIRLHDQSNDRTQKRSIKDRIGGGIYVRENYSRPRNGIKSFRIA